MIIKTKHSMQKMSQRGIHKNLLDIVEIFSTRNTYEILNKSKIFISAQKYTNYPSQCLLEAMSSENAIIATNVGETSLLVRNRFNGFLINPNSTDLENKILELIKDEDLIRTMGKRSRSLILKKYNLLEAIKYYTNIWRKICWGL